MKTETKYKLTDENMRTHGGLRWALGETVRAHGAGNELCTAGVLHAYDDPLLAALLNPIHANYNRPRLFRISCDVVVSDGLKVGSKWQKLECEVDLPRPSIECRVAFGILCGLVAFHTPAWRMWAWNWLDGTDRSANAADAVNAAAYAAYAAEAAYAATYAVNAAACAAYAASYGKALDLPALAEMAFRLTADGV